jgi:hypothetical protein
MASTKRGKKRGDLLFREFSAFLDKGELQGIWRQPGQQPADKLKVKRRCFHTGLTEDVYRYDGTPTPLRKEWA